MGLRRVSSGDDVFGAYLAFAVQKNCPFMLWLPHLHSMKVYALCRHVLWHCALAFIPSWSDAGDWTAAH